MSTTILIALIAAWVLVIVLFACWWHASRELIKHRDPLQRHRQAVISEAKAHAERILANAREQALLIVADLQRDAQAEADRVVAHALALDE